MLKKYQRKTIPTNPPPKQNKKKKGGGGEGKATPFDQGGGRESERGGAVIASNRLGLRTGKASHFTR